MTHGRILVFSTLALIFVSAPAGAKPKSPDSVYSLPDDHAVEQMLKHLEGEDAEPAPPSAPLKIQEQPHPPPPEAAAEDIPSSPLSHRERVSPEVPATGEAKTYKVYIWQENGDTLWRIAQKVYGDKDKWPLIYNANRDILQDPNKIYPRQVLKIPPLNEAQ